MSAIAARNTHNPIVMYSANGSAMRRLSGSPVCIHANVPSKPIQSTPTTASKATRTPFIARVELFTAGVALLHRCGRGNAAKMND